MPARRIVAALVLVLLNLARAEPVTPALAAVPLDDLRRTYLHCDWVSARQTLDAGIAMRCSAVAEVLQQRAHDGRFEQLIAWWRGARELGHDPVAGAAVADRVLRLVDVGRSAAPAAGTASL